MKFSMFIVELDQNVHFLKNVHLDEKQVFLSSISGLQSSIDQNLINLVLHLVNLVITIHLTIPPYAPLMYISILGCISTIHMVQIEIKLVTNLPCVMDENINVLTHLGPRNTTYPAYPKLESTCSSRC